MNNKVKFPPQLQAEFISELRQKVKEYFENNGISKYGNSGMIVKSVFMILLYMVPYFLLLSGIIASVWMVLLLWIVMGVGMAGLGMGLMHDANHGSFSKNRGVNTFFAKSIYLLGGFPANWQYQHNTLHHGFTNIDGKDEDIDSIGLLRFSPHKPLRAFHKFQHWYAWFFYGLMTVSWSTVKDFQQLNKYYKSDAVFSGNKSYKQILLNIILGKILYYIVFIGVPMVLIPVSWYWILLGYFAMHFTCGFILGVVFQTAHVVPSSEYPLPNDTGTMENNWAIHQLHTTSDFAPKSRILSWFIGGLNFQVEHHLFPNVCHVHYKKLSKIVKETAAKYNLPYHVNPNFFDAVRSHGQMLRFLGR